MTDERVAVNVEDIRARYTGNRIETDYGDEVRFLLERLDEASADLARIAELEAQSDDLDAEREVERVMRKKAEAERDEAREERDRLRDLLATVNRDGGHRAAEVGVDQAVAEAIEEWARLMTAAEERGRLAAALEEAERCALVSIHGMDACDFCGVPQRGGERTHEDDCPFRALANGKDGGEVWGNEV